MRASLVIVRSPFHPSLQREVSVIGRRRRVRALAPRINRPFIALLNGQPLLRAQWARRVKDGDVLAFVVLPQGGKGGSNPLSMIIMLAVMTFAPQLGMLAYEGMVGASAITSAGALMAGQIAAFAGMMLVNAILPAAKQPSNLQAQALAAPSPTYNLQAQGNTARLEQAIPVQYGRMMAYPDFAAQPYAEYAGNDQYLYHLLCLGQGEYAVESIRIEDTPTDHFEEIDYEIVAPGAALTLFPANVVTSTEVSGQEINSSAEFSLTLNTLAFNGPAKTLTATSGTPFTGVVSNIWITISGAANSVNNGVYQITVATSSVLTLDNVDMVTAAAGPSITLAQVSTGPFIATAAGQHANYLAIDVVFPRGLYLANSAGGLDSVNVTWTVKADPVDDNGDPIGGPSLLEYESYSAATTTPQRLSYRYALPVAGRYQVSLTRTDIKQLATTYGHDLYWAGLRAYLPETRDFGNVTLLAVRMRASNQLSGMAARKINVIATRKLPIWNGTTWSAPTATRSIAWAFADAARNSDYGASRMDSQLDLAALLKLDQTWGERGDTFDGRFDATLIAWEAFTKIARAGRAKPYEQGGILRIVRDQAINVPVALYSMRNIVRGSFGIEYITPTDDTADAVSVGYFDELTWQPRRITASIPPSAATNPAKIDLFGVVQRQQALNEGLYEAANNLYRRKLIKFTTEMEGFIPAFGDLVVVQHDMPQWGQYAEAVAWDANTLMLTVSEPLTWTPGQEHYIGLRRKDGSMMGPYNAIPGVDEYSLILDTAPDVAPYTGGEYERTQITFGWAETWRQLARIVGILPRSLHSVEIACVNEDVNVHLADQGMLADVAASSQLASIYTRPNVSGLISRAMQDDVNKAVMSWSPAPGADHYLIEQSEDGANWTRCGETGSNNYTATAIYGSRTQFRVAAVGLTTGLWTTVIFNSGAAYMWATLDTALMWTGDTNLMWST